MDTKFSRRDNFITLNKDVVVEARKGRVPKLVDVGYKLPISNRVKNTAIPKWGYDANVYMHIMFTNMLIMHIRENLCIIIPKKIVTVYGEEIDVAERLSKYYFTINTVNDEVITRIGKRRYKMYRMLYSLIMYGDESKRVPSQFDVHHKWMRYLNIMECMTLLGKREHLKVHNKTSMASHRMGRVIRDIDDLKLFIREIENSKEFWKNREY